MTVPRERDDRGRPRNARPRDGLGRPLPRGSAEAPVPDQVTLAPLDAIPEAQRLLDDGLPFRAHEVLEATWKAAPAEERQLWQGLTQLAVGFTHCLRGNATGARNVLTRGRQRLVPFQSNPPYDLDIPGLLSWVDRVLAGLPHPSVAPDAPRLRQP